MLPRTRRRDGVSTLTIRGRSEDACDREEVGQQCVRAHSFLGHGGRDTKAESAELHEVRPKIAALVGSTPIVHPLNQSRSP